MSTPQDQDFFQKSGWWQKIVAWKDSVIARLRANPLLVLAVAFMSISFVLFVGTTFYKGATEHAISTPLMQTQEGTLNEVMVALKNDNLQSITKHVIYKNAYWLDQELIEVSVFKMKSGEALRIDTSVLPEEFWKKITQASEESAFLITTGEQLPKPSRLLRISGLMFLYSSLIMVFLFAQSMIGQVVSGHTFSADRRDRNIRMKDVIGYPEVKREVSEIMDKINNATAYTAQGIRAPRGLLFLGDPGVGKTMLAKAMANEMGAEFFYCTGADFAEMYVGVGPRRVRSLFKRARKHAKAFIFIDEIDAIGARNSMGNDSERQSTINQFLAEMDGMNNNGTLLVVGATNHANMLDPALRRPGRFDKEIHIPLPDLETRKGILEKYFTGIQLDDNVDLEAIAHRTQGYSGAMLSGLVEETKNLALRKAAGGDLVVRQETIELAQEIKLLGVGTTKAHPEDLDRVAVHELGHALAGLLHCPDVHVEKVTVAGRGHALGFTSMRPLHDRTLRTEKSLRGDLIMRLAGRAAEDVILGGVSSGAADDLERATELAREMVGRLGMGGATGLMVPPKSVDPGVVPDSVRADVRELLEQMYAQAKQMIEDHRDWIAKHRTALQDPDIDTIGHDALRAGLID